MSDPATIPLRRDVGLWRTRDPKRAEGFLRVLRELADDMSHDRSPAGKLLAEDYALVADILEGLRAVKG